MTLSQSTGGPLSSFKNEDFSTLDLGISDDDLVDELLGHMNRYFYVQFCKPDHEPYFAQEVYVNFMQDFALVNFANQLVFSTCFHDDKVWDIFAKVMFERTGYVLFYEIHNLTIH